MFRLFQYSTDITNNEYEKFVRVRGARKFNTLEGEKETSLLTAELRQTAGGIEIYFEDPFDVNDAVKACAYTVGAVLGRIPKINVKSGDLIS
jgi:hypothetical protein